MAATLRSCPGNSTFFGGKLAGADVTVAVVQGNNDLPPLTQNGGAQIALKSRAVRTPSPVTASPQAQRVCHSKGYAVLSVLCAG